MSKKITRLSIDVDDKQLEFYKSISSEMGISMSALIRLSLVYYTNDLQEKGIIKRRVDDDE